MEVIQSEALTSNQGRELFWVTLVNDKGSAVRVTNLGCIIQSVIVPDRDGVMRDVTLGFDRVEDYFSEAYLADCPYFGAIVGRYANRISGARYSWGGQVHELSRNDGNNQLHGGGNFSRNPWQIVSTDPAHASVTFRYDSPDGEAGYPGNLRAEVTYRLTNDNELIYQIQAVTDQPTPVNMTNHAYFNLHGDASYIGDHRVGIPASLYFAQAEDLAVTGELLAVQGTPYDFTHPRTVDASWNPETGYDQAFLLNKAPAEWGLMGRAWSSKSGISLDVLSAEPVVQFYTGGFLNGIAGKGGQAYDKFSGFCFETHQHPNSVNIPDFPDTILRPGDTYRQTTVFKFGLEEF
ncbi:MAG TPA: aldose epimerase family protein [Sphingobacteriaceae bacterium]